MRAAALLTAAALGLAALGCGGTDEGTATVGTTTPASLGYTKGLSGAKRDAAAAVADYNAALLNGDGERICELTSRGEKALAACKDNLASTFEPQGAQPRRHVSAIELHGRQARVTLTASSAKPVYFTLVKDGGQWKILVVSNQP